ncbi:MAG: pro-sigmaK processing inhibitor BofA family protein [Ruminococcus sp.]|nr:pro-sigmaK processing inhibitor BofA family protein [Ruminococcus sp.]
MPLWGVAVIILSTLIVFAIIHYIGKNKHPMKRAFMSLCCGGLTLLAVNLSSGITGVYLPVSLLSILISIIGGIPGVTLMLGLNLFF